MSTAGSSRDEWSFYFSKQDKPSSSTSDSDRRSSEELRKSMTRNKSSLRRRSWTCPVQQDEYLYISEAIKDSSPGWRGLNGSEAVTPSPGNETPQMIHNRKASCSASDSSQSTATSHFVEKNSRRSGVYKHQVRDASRLSSDSFQDEELEAARMRSVSHLEFYFQVFEY